MSVTEDNVLRSRGDGGAYNVWAAFRAVSPSDSSKMLQLFLGKGAPRGPCHTAGGRDPPQVGPKGRDAGVGAGSREGVWPARWTSPQMKRFGQQALRPPGSPAAVLILWISQGRCGVPVTPPPNLREPGANSGDSIQGMRLESKDSIVTKPFVF